MDLDLVGLDPTDLDPMALGRAEVNPMDVNLVGLDDLNSDGFAHSACTGATRAKVETY